MTRDAMAATAVQTPTGVTPPAPIRATRWQRAAEVTGLIAIGLLGAAGVFPW